MNILYSLVFTLCALLGDSTAARAMYPLSCSELNFDYVDMDTSSPLTSIEHGNPQRTSVSCSS